MGVWLRGLDELDRTRVALVGGKAAHLGELSRLDGIQVPPGFCVTTEAFRRVLASEASIGARLDQLSALEPGDRAGIRQLSAELRHALATAPMPEDLVAEIDEALAALGEPARWAVRSSATAEDLPTASFAGQYDSWLDVDGASVVDHVRRCWASAFTERAVTARLQRGDDPCAVQLAVLVQRSVRARVSGVAFTADPLTGHRGVTCVEAVPGRGDALVSGRANPDVVRVRDGVVVDRAVAGPAPALTDAEVVALARLGRRIEAHFGCPQDLEWCLDDEGVHLVQARPITTLFPLPEVNDGRAHVWVSVGHQQMMTDAMTPLGVSVFQRTAGRPMDVAGGRLFVDVAAALASPVTRSGLVDVLGRSDPLIGDALRTLVERGDFPPPAPSDGTPPAPTSPPPLEADPALVADLIARSDAALAAAERDLSGRSGADLVDHLLADLDALKRQLFAPDSQRVILAAIDASRWLDERLRSWWGDPHADQLARSVSGNVTSEMGLALLELADVLRPHPEVVAALRGAEGDAFLDDLEQWPGGRRVRDAFLAFLDRHGRRCPGEIDLARPRWSERPSALLPVLLGHVERSEPGAAARRFQDGAREAEAKAREVLERARALPDGERAAEEVGRVIARLRTFAGYREFPKYAMMGRYAVYRRALLGEAERLVRAGVLAQPDDAFFLTLDELREVARSGRADPELVRRRREEHRWHTSLAPPRVFTSDGEVVRGAYRRDDLPEGSLVGLGVAAGTAEGRARVVLDPADAELRAGDILVTVWTDPSWTPLFVAIAGLVTEVGGRLTHGAVIAREYGLPAVVGVEGATRRIRDGQRIRVHGADGYVELLPDPGAAR